MILVVHSMIASHTRACRNELLVAFLGSFAVAVTIAVAELAVVAAITAVMTGLKACRRFLYAGWHRKGDGEEEEGRCSAQGHADMAYTALLRCKVAALISAAWTCVNHSRGERGVDVAYLVGCVMRSSVGVLEHLCTTLLNS